MRCVQARQDSRPPVRGPPRRAAKGADEPRFETLPSDEHLQRGEVLAARSLRKRAGGSSWPFTEAFRLPSGVNRVDRRMRHMRQSRRPERPRVEHHRGGGLAIFFSSRRRFHEVEGLGASSRTRRRSFPTSRRRCTAEQRARRMQGTPRTSGLRPIEPDCVERVRKRRFAVVESHRENDSRGAKTNFFFGSSKAKRRATIPASGCAEGVGKVPASIRAKLTTRQRARA